MHRCITALTEKASVQRICGLLEMNRSSFYRARQRSRRLRPPCAQRQRVKETFEQWEWTYGSRRVQVALGSHAVEVSRYRVRRYCVVSTALAVVLPEFRETVRRDFRPG